MHKVYRDFFTEEDLHELENIITKSPWRTAQAIGSNSLVTDSYNSRRSDICIAPPEQIPIKYRNKLLEAFNEVKPGKYLLVEHWGINRYRFDNKGCFKWHKDRLSGFHLLASDIQKNITPEEIFIRNTRPTREMSASIALTDRSNYTGGQFVIDKGDGRRSPVGLNRGDAIVFDSDTFHGVEEVTEGFRQALIVWAVDKVKWEEWKALCFEDK